MSKTYSNKALPAGTVLREWRLEEVLGVGGFGIVYKGRGIYFGELVAIKEYFPSAISERQAGDTVVPIDSDAEEVHALGLKKFVEEAKLLWNLSKPTRHPNIVSVRSLFEIHGTAYMVMDFEDGMSLSKLLREGKRFNEASLLALIQPIAEGLERAHRVGVLHRDIKPPNILVNEDGRPVLIDFGSARFESGEATSTKVTFHTPPYAAIEQYVKTYAQGPWTDIYALGVVLYECVAGQKPPEVLERMHGGLGQPLSDGEWPGFSRTFLKAVDAAMTIRPADRPQSISEWLALFSNPQEDNARPPVADDFDEPTRFVPFEDLSEKIVPVAPPPPDFDIPAEIETPVPDDTSQVEFKRAGFDTNASKTQATEAQAAQAAVAPKAPKAVKKDVPKPAAKPAPARASNRKALALGAVAVAALLAGGGWYLAGRDRAPSDLATAALPADGAGMPATATETVAADTAAGEVAQALQSLAAEARRAGAPAQAVAEMDGAASRVAALQADRASLSGPALAARDAEIAALTRAASVAFVGAIARDADARAQKLARDLPWANPRLANSARGEPAPRQKIAQDLKQARASLTAATVSANSASEPGIVIAAARQALRASRGFVGLFAVAYASKSTPAAGQQAAVIETQNVVPIIAATPTSTPQDSTVTSGTGVSPAKMQQFNAAVSSARDVATTVIRMAQVDRPGSNASNEAKDRYRLLQQNKSSAQGYQGYLNNLASSIRRAKSDREAQVFISQAEQTKRYLNVLLSRSQ